MKARLGEQLAAGLRRASLRLSQTPLHPQWFSFRSKAAAANAMEMLADGWLLDLGCGDGELGRRLASRCRYVGLDNPTSAAGRYAASADVFADAATLPFADGCFDRVALLDVLEHLPAPEVALREMHRVLRPGGVLCIHVPMIYPLHDEPYDFQRLTRHGLALRLREAGFEVRKITSQGAPAETAALMANIALGRLVVRAARAFAPSIALAVVAAPVVLAVNTLGWLMGFPGRSDTVMPVAYWAEAAKPGQASSGRPQ